MEPSCRPSITAKKRWKTLRIVFSILQKGVTKSKLFLDDLYMVSKQDKLIPWKALNNLNMCHPTTAPACGSHDVQASFISPLHYEFSCSSSPPYDKTRRRRSRHRDTRQYRNRVNKGYTRFHAQPMFMYDMVAPAGSVDTVDDVHWNVDMAAEEFIDSFYKELMLQKMNCYSRS